MINFLALGKKTKIQNYFSFNYLNFSQTTKKRVSPEEIRNVIRLMRINNSQINFAQHELFKQWKNLKEAIHIFNDYTNNINKLLKTDYLTNPNIFEDIKLLLKNIEDEFNSKDNNSSQTYFFKEFTKILRKIYVDNFKNFELIDGNIQYCLRCFVFIKTINEYEFLVSNTEFLNEFFLIIEECSNIYVNKLFTENFDKFIKNAGTMEEFLFRFVKLCQSKYIIAYNPKFYYYSLIPFIEKILSNFENLVLHLVITLKPELLQDKLKELATLIAARKINCPKIVDYMNIFLVKHRTHFNIFYMIEMLNCLSMFQGSNNYEMLNYFYSCLEKEANSQNLINFPKEYIINSIRIIAKERILGDFVIVEKLIKSLIDKTSDLTFVEVLNIIFFALKVGFNEKNTLDYLFNIILKNKLIEGITYSNIRHLKSLFLRFIKESYTNIEFFKATLKTVSIKLQDLKKLKDNYKNEEFVEFIKNELIITKEDFLAEILTFEDYMKYMDMLQIIEIQCHFKLYNNHEFKSLDTIEFYNEDGNRKVVNYVCYEGLNYV